jgi:hypothetical protein
MNASILGWMFRLMLACLCLAAGSAQAVYSCNVSATSLGVIYAQGTNTRIDATGTVTLNCTRNVATDANTLTYGIAPDDGANENGGNRRARLAASGNYLTYTLTRGTTAGGGATCQDTNNWNVDNLPANVILGTLNFGTAASASVTWGFCARVRGNQGSPTAGLYVDNIIVTAAYPATLSGATTTAAFTYTIGAINQCVLSSQPSNMAFNYGSFQAAPQVTTQTFALACSNALPWSVAITPANGTLLGLNYTLARAPTAGSGTGNPQNIVITATMPAGQQGTCPTGSCSATQPHTLTITY